MIEALTYASYVALALAAWTAFQGGPSAGALVASNVVARLVYTIGLPVTYDLLFILDILVIVFIYAGMVRRGRPLLREAAIILLFPIAWRFYWLPAEEQYVAFCVITSVVIVQLMLTLPLMTIRYLALKALGRNGPMIEPSRLEKTHA